MKLASAFCLALFVIGMLTVDGEEKYYTFFFLALSILIGILSYIKNKRLNK